MFHIDSTAYQPDDAALLLRATANVIKAVSNDRSLREADREQAARAVLDVARAGYGRGEDHHLNADDLAEAAIVRYRTTVHRER